MWQDILIKFEDSMQYTESGRTMAQWQQLFNESVKRLTQLVSFVMMGDEHL